MSNHRPSGSGSPYTGSASPKALTSERIAADIAAFNKAGGHIEVLGNTPFAHKSKEDKAAASADNGTAMPGQSSNPK